MVKRLSLIALLLVSVVSNATAQTGTKAVFVGDSLTLGALSTGYVGFAGMASAEMGWTEQRFVWYHVADALVRWDEVGAEEPDVIVVELGVHAIVGCDHLLKSSGAEFKLWYKKVLDKAVLDAPLVCALEIPWMDWDQDSAARATWYNQKIAEAAAESEAVVIPAWDATVGCYDCIGSDGFHLNDLGHELIASQIVSHCHQNEALVVQQAGPASFLPVILSN